MAHDIERGSDIAYYGQVPWHGLGVVLADPYDLDAAVLQAFRSEVDPAVAWDIVMSDAWVRYADGTGRMVDPDVCRMITRSDNGRVFGSGRGGYRGIGPVECFEPLRAALESRRVSLTCLAALGGGERVFACVELASREIASGDRLTWYLTITSANDGSGAWKAFLTVIRTVCRNTLSAGLGGAATVVTVRHTQDAGARIAAFGDALNSATDTIEQNVKAFAAMSRTYVNASQVNAFVAELLPLPEKPEQHARAVANVAKGRAIMTDLFETGDGSDLASARGTVWGLYQAATAYASHVQRAKQDAEARLFRMTEGSGAQFVAKAESLALAMVA